jgi:hypothetical protein
VIVRTAAAIAAIGLVVAPRFAGAQAVSRFDGAYDLRSTTVVPGSASLYGKGRCSLQLHARPLQITGGHATTMFRHDSDAVGDVGPLGALALKDSGAFLEFTGKIDLHGVLRGYLNTFDGCGCGGGGAASALEHVLGQHVAHGVEVEPVGGDQVGGVGDNLVDIAH